VSSLLPAILADGSTSYTKGVALANDAPLLPSILKE